MKRSSWIFAAAAAVGLAGGMASAAPVSVDGVIGSEWNGITPVFVAHDAAAPIGNFQAPGNTTAGASYSIQVRDDGSYYYAALQITGDVASNAGDFANLYFDTDPQNHNGSDVGFEVTNNDYFIAGVPGSYIATPYLTYAVDAGTHTIELAIANGFFTNSPVQGPFVENAIGNVTLRLSQSFGYSVAGGISYGDDFHRLGSAPVVAPVPLPSSAWAGLALIGGLGLVAGTRRLRHQEV